MSSQQESQNTTTPLDEFLSNLPEHYRPYYLKPDEVPTVPLTLLVRYEDEENPENFHYEAWSKNEETGEPEEIVFYTSQYTEEADVKSSWQQFKKFLTQPNYRKNILSEVTIH